MRRFSWIHAIPIILIPGAIGIAPLFFMSFEDIMEKAGPPVGFFFGIAGLICGLGIFEFLRCFLVEFQENRLLRNSESATRLKAKVLTDNQSLTNTNTVMLGAKNKVFMHIHYYYTDTHGNQVSKYSAKMYSPLEIQYLTDLGEFDILVRGKTSVVAETLDEQIIVDFYNNR